MMIWEENVQMARWPWKTYELVKSSKRRVCQNQSLEFTRVWFHLSASLSLIINTQKSPSPQPLHLRGSCCGTWMPHLLRSKLNNWLLTQSFNSLLRVHPFPPDHCCKSVLKNPEQVKPESIFLPFTWKVDINTWSVLLSTTSWWIQRIILKSMWCLWSVYTRNKLTPYWIMRCGRAK